MIPARFGKYHVLGRLAQGGMAEIFKVKTVGLAGFEKVQVLKKILPAHAQHPRFIRSFIDEARIAASLNHRNIVQVFDFGRVGNELFLAMELIEGVNLREAGMAARRQGRPFGIPLACFVLAETAAGLDFAHRRRDDDNRPLNIVHCDVSPQNVALSWEGYVKVVDFGVARATFVASETGRLRGKPRYMAPEQTRGHIPAASADVFALGVVAWELCTGTPLFEGSDVESILRAIQRLEVRDPRALNPAVPDRLAEGILQALRRAPDERGTTADLAALFSRVGHELDPQAGSRSLARFLAELFPDSPLNRDADPLEDPSRTSTSRVAFGEGEPSEGSDPESGASLPLNESDLLSLEADVPAPLEEKRRVVVVVCRWEGVDRRRTERAVADLAYKQGAVVHTRGAGEMVILFGLEQAGEDDVAAALRFAMSAGGAVEPDAQLRAGVRLAVARRRGGGGYLLLGDAVDDARALAEAAGPGRILSGGVPGRLAQDGFAFREAPPLRRRGRRLRAVELVGPAAPRRAPRPASGPLFGRREELASLVETFRAAARNGARTTIGLLGEAGIGKTRLVGELARAVGDAEGEVRIAAALPGGGDTPYAAVCDLLAQEVGLPPARTPPGRARVLDRLSRRLALGDVAPADRAEVTAAIAAALELWGGAAPRGDPPSASALRDRVAFALTTLWATTRSPRPRLVVIEDWHWLDGASADALRHVLAAPISSHELFVLTSRPTDDGGPPAWPKGVSILPLGELAADDAAALARARLPDGADPDDVVQILRRAGGNPLFIEELAVALGDFVPGELPENARTVIAARVDRLPHAAKVALQYAAVYGPLVRGRHLEDLLGPGAARGLSILEKAGLLVRRDEDLEFRHGILQEVVYESLSAAARRGAHLRIGALLGERYQAGREGSPAAIARHFDLGGEPHRAAAYWLRGGELALAAFDAPSARDAFTRVLALGDGASEHERDAYAGRAQALVHLGEHGAARLDLERLVERARGDEPRLADAWGRMAFLHLRTGELPAALSAADLAAGAGEPRARALAHRVRAEVYERRAEHDAALAEIGRALEIHRRIGDRALELECLVVAGRIHLGRLRTDAALIQYLPALDRAVALGDPRVERLVRTSLATAYLIRGSFEEALRSGERALDLCRRLSDRAHEAEALSLLGAIHLELGRADAAEEQLGEGLALHAQTGARLARADALVHAGRRQAMAGDLAAAERTFEEAVALAGETGARSVVCNARTQLAAVRAAAGRHAEAEAVARQAVAEAREAALPGFEIQALSRLALARLEGNDPARARGPSEKAIALLDAIGAIEGSEEEVYHTHHRILRALGDPGAGAFLARAHAGLAAKLARIEHPTLRKSFEELPLHRRIREEFAERGIGLQG